MKWVKVLSLAVLAGVACEGRENMDHPIYLGAAEIEITPEEPMQLIGMGREFKAHDGECFEYSQRDNPAMETHDPLMLQANCLRQAEKKVILLTADLLYTVALDKVRAAVAVACDIPEEAVFYAASHNHSAPGGTEAYSALLCQRAAECAKQAVAALRPVAAEHARGHFDRLSHDRAEPWGEVDGSVDVVRFTAIGTGDLVSLWWNYSCHPCSLSWDFNEYSADYPGVIRQRVAEALGQSVPVAFLAGCAGNVQAIGMKRFSSPPQMYLGVPKGDYEMVERMGSCIAEAGLAALAAAPRPLDLGDLQFEKYTITLPVQVHHNTAGLREMRAEQGADGLIADADKLVCKWLDGLIAQGDAEEKIRIISGGLVSLGELAIVFTPLELAWQMGGRIREDSPYSVTLFSTTSLGFESYLTEKKFYELEPEKRPYEAFGLQSAAGFSYIPETPAVFEAAVVEKLHLIHRR